MKNYLIIFFVIFSFNSMANEIAIVDLDFIIKNSKKGQKLISEIEKKNEIIFDEFNKKEVNFIKKEKELVSKKNVLSNEEFNKDLNELKKAINDHNKLKNNKFEELNIERKKKFIELSEQIKKILIEFSNKNNIKTVIDRKYILISKTETDITKEILEIINK